MEVKLFNAEDEETAAMLTLYQQGWTYTAIARAFNIPNYRVTLIIKNAGIARERKPRTKVTSDMHRRIHELSSQGLYQYEIADLVGLTQNTVSRYLQVSI